MSHDSKKEWPGAMFAGSYKDIEPFEIGDCIKPQEHVYDFFGRQEYSIEEGQRVTVKEMQWMREFQTWGIIVEEIGGIYNAEKFVKSE